MNKRSIIALILIIAAIGGILALTGDYTTYASFNEAFKNPGKEFHIVGELTQPEEMLYEPKKDPNFFSFLMKDGEGQVQKVIYRSNKPQDFERSEQIVIVGYAAGEEIVASSILMKCPSKYVEDELQLEQAS